MSLPLDKYRIVLRPCKSLNIRIVCFPQQVDYSHGESGQCRTLLLLVELVNGQKVLPRVCQVVDLEKNHLEKKHNCPMYSDQLHLAVITLEFLVVDESSVQRASLVNDFKNELEYVFNYLGLKPGAF